MYGGRSSSDLKGPMSLHNEGSLMNNMPCQGVISVTVGHVVAKKLFRMCSERKLGSLRKRFCSSIKVKTVTEIVNRKTNKYFWLDM